MKDIIYFRIGPVYTYEPFVSLNYNIIKDYFFYLKNNTDIFEKYKVDIFGGCLFDISKTKDIDIVLSKNCNSIKELENDMSIMYEVAFNKFNILIDVQWRENSLPEFIKCDYIIENKSDLIIDSCGFLVFKNPINRFTLFRKMYESYQQKNELFIWKYGNFIQKLVDSSSNLYTLEQNRDINDKTEHIKKISTHLIEGLYRQTGWKYINYALNNPNKHLIPSFDASLLFTTNEEYYQNNTNYHAINLKNGKSGTELLKEILE